MRRKRETCTVFNNLHAVVSNRDHTEYTVPNNTPHKPNDDDVRIIPREGNKTPIQASRQPLPDGKDLYFTSNIFNTRIHQRTDDNRDQGDEPDLPCKGSEPIAPRDLLGGHRDRFLDQDHTPIQVRRTKGNFFGDALGGGCPIIDDNILFERGAWRNRKDELKT